MEARGAVIGAFGFCAAVGILFFTGIGGLLFDEWMYAAPFLFVGFASGLLGLFGLWVFAKAPGSASVRRKENENQLSPNIGA